MDLSSFSDIKSLVKTGDYNASKLFSVMVIPFGSARMPPSPYDALSEEQLRTVALWIEQGAKITPVCQQYVIRQMYFIQVPLHPCLNFIVRDVTVVPILRKSRFDDLCKCERGRG